MRRKSEAESRNERRKASRDFVSSERIRNSTVCSVSFLLHPGRALPPFLPAPVAPVGTTTNEQMLRMSLPVGERLSMIRGPKPLRNHPRPRRNSAPVTQAKHDVAVIVRRRHQRNRESSRDPPLTIPDLFDVVRNRHSRQVMDQQISQQQAAE
jgi:hypothetical protein